MARRTTRALTRATQVSLLLAIALLGRGVLSGEGNAFRTVEQRYLYAPAMASASVSGDGRLVAFESLARLLPLDTNSITDIYVLDIDSGRVELASVGADGAASKDGSSTPRLSGDGRYIAYDSVASPSQSTCVTVFLRDRHDTIARPVATAWNDRVRVVCAMQPAISADGQWVAFESSAQDLVDDVDANGALKDVYIVNTSTGRTARVSVASDGTQSRLGSSYAASVNATGRLVAFTSTACLDGGPSDSPSGSTVAPCRPRVYVRDLSTGVTRGVSAAGRARPNGSTYSAMLSADGRYAAFVSTATNLAPGDTNERPDVYTYDVSSGTLELVSRTRTGKAGNGASARPAVSETGRFVAFDSVASDLMCARGCAARDQDHNLVRDVFLLDRESGGMKRLSQGPEGMPWWESSGGPALDGAGRIVAYTSRHARDSGDLRADFDLFVMKTRND